MSTIGHNRTLVEVIPSRAEAVVESRATLSAMKKPSRSEQEVLVVYGVYHRNYAAGGVLLEA